jgi:hypothetical protein
VYGSITVSLPSLQRMINLLTLSLYSVSGCIGKLGSVTADIVTPMTFRATGSISWTFWIAAMINVGALFIVVILNLIDSANDLRRKKLRYLRKSTAVERNKHRIGINSSVNESFYSMDSSALS